MAHYDSRDGLNEAIKSLAALNKLLGERHHAGYNHKESLQEWVILGRYYLDTCGNTWKYRASDPRMDKIPAEQYPNLPEVMTLKEFIDYIAAHSLPGAEPFFSSSINSDIPDADIRCPVCDNYWAVDNCHDVVVEHRTEVVDISKYAGRRLSDVTSEWELNQHEIWFIQPDKGLQNKAYIDMTPRQDELAKQYGWVVNQTGWIKPDPHHLILDGDHAMVNIWVYRHLNCHRKNQAAREETYFRQIFVDAGFKNIVLIQKANEYCPCESCAPWYQVIADNTLFTIGWRKRVIEIQSHDSRFDFARLFHKEDVTMGSNYIHAWSKTKCVEYLKTIKNIVG